MKVVLVVVVTFARLVLRLFLLLFSIENLPIRNIELDSSAPLNCRKCFIFFFEPSLSKNKEEAPITISKGMTETKGGNDVHDRHIQILVR